MGKGDLRRASNNEHYKIIEDDSWLPSGNWENEDPEKTRKEFKERFGFYPEEIDEVLSPLKTRKWED